MDIPKPNISQHYSESLLLLSNKGLYVGEKNNTIQSLYIFFPQIIQLPSIWYINNCSPAVHEKRVKKNKKPKQAEKQKWLQANKKS